MGTTRLASGQRSKGALEDPDPLEVKNIARVLTKDGR